MASSADSSSTATAAPIRPRAELVTEYRYRLEVNRLHMLKAHKDVGLKIIQAANLATCALNRILTNDPEAAHSMAVSDAARVRLSYSLAALDVATDELADLLPWDERGIPGDLDEALARVLEDKP